MEHAAGNIMMHAPRSMDDAMPMTHSSSFKVGDRIKIKPGKEHESMEGEEKSMEGMVVEIGSPALAIQFDGDEEVHKWYVASELLAAEN